jgi:hypothetical protein
VTPPSITATTTTTQGLLSAVRAACSVLCGAPTEISAVTLTGDLEPGSTALPLLARAESLAREFGYGVVMHVARDRYEIRFSRLHGAAAS